MNYTILPKKGHIPNFLFGTQSQGQSQLKNVKNQESYISHSVQHHYCDVFLQLDRMKKNESAISNDYFKEIEKIMMNQYEFLFSKVSGSKFSVSKLRPSSREFYVYMELMYSNSILEHLKNRNINCLFFSSSGDVFVECMNILREDYKDIHITVDSLSYKENNFSITAGSSVDFLYIDLKNENECGENQCENQLGNQLGNQLENKSINQTNYIFNCIHALYNTLVYQKYQGVTIVKLDTLIHRNILEIVYLYTCFFEKVAIVKPNASNIITNERFLVCKNYRLETLNYDFCNKLLIFSKMNTIDYPLLQFELPYFFLNKIEESNVSIGFQQIEQIDLIMNVIKNKNREEKLENIKKSNIQKCIQWCEKYKIPHNKFFEKGNIFLPENREENREECVFVNESTNEETIEVCEDNEESVVVHFIEDSALLHNDSTTELEYYANQILEEQINMGIDEYLYEPTLYI
jgi:23S rRNA U2552 (ribose-2'-O)-methylase RlmE/FtsJ